MNYQRAKERKIRKISKLGENDDVSSNLEIHEQIGKDVPREGKERYNIKIKPEKTSDKTKSKLEELRRTGFKIIQRICFKCLSENHSPYNCPVYQSAITEDPCTYQYNNQRRICGWHLPRDCKRQNENQRKLSRTNGKPVKVDIWQRRTLD